MIRSFSDSVFSLGSTHRFFHRTLSVYPSVMGIPVVDFSPYRLDQKKVSNSQLKNLTKDLKRAFTEVGFVVLTNTGITHEEVDCVMDISRKFFKQSEKLKLPFSRGNFSQSSNHGWVSLETERLNPRRPGDLKEAFNVALLQSDIRWPSVESKQKESFQDIHSSFFLRCKELSLRVLRVMAHGLNLDPEVFVGPHRNIGTDKNSTALRSLYYPPVNSEEAKEGQLRCGEHSDYGSITLLFQSSEGLEVLSRSGEYMAAPCIPGGVLVNIADLMQRWTSDEFVSVRHRVLLPSSGDSRTRQSMAFFVHPDDESLITCCDGSDKYPPVTAGDYLIERFKNSYGQ
ncbi:2-oxoglutarate-dependent dioxygenase htyE-like [Notolabrus celidotus]|uniref:2-oxoglutarate-dependent dioxygenase htyE-like n=1 Tax=Notolabrus celidotus TaxID=1203425 RepID=UPI00148F881D|nr:2-oxoglutarate-dependent dioxygenase htyE-like [Notolabrus celidotus]